MSRGSRRGWLRCIGLRRFGYGVAALVGVFAAALGVYLYVQTLPELLRVAADVAPRASRASRTAT